MGHAPVLQQVQRHNIKCVAILAAAILFGSACRAQEAVVQGPGSPWDQELSKYPGLLPEFGQLFDKLSQNVQFPPPRAKSRLLPLLPPSAIVYGAIPNYGDAASQTLKIFRQELHDSTVLRDWWQHGQLAAAGPKLEDSLDKFLSFTNTWAKKLSRPPRWKARIPACWLFQKSASRA